MKESYIVSNKIEARGGCVHNLKKSISIDDGAAAPLQTLMWALMKNIAREMSIRIESLSAG